MSDRSDDSRRTTATHYSTLTHMNGSAVERPPPQQPRRQPTAAAPPSTPIQQPSQPPAAAPPSTPIQRPSQPPAAAPPSTPSQQPSQPRPQQTPQSTVASRMRSSNESLTRRQTPPHSPMALNRHEARRAPALTPTRPSTSTAQADEDRSVFIRYRVENHPFASEAEMVAILAIDAGIEARAPCFLTRDTLDLPARAFIVSQ